MYSKWPRILEIIQNLYVEDESIGALTRSLGIINHKGVSLDWNTLSDAKIMDISLHKVKTDIL